MRISQAESVVMDVLWKDSPRTAEEIAADIGEAQGWSDATVRTLVGRLVKKKAVAAQKDGRRFLYSPLVAREDYVDAESQGLIDRLFEGRLGPLFVHFSERRKLTPQDVAELKRLIEEFEDGR